MLRLGYGVAIQRKTKAPAIPKNPIVAISSSRMFFIVLLLLGAPWRVKVEGARAPVRLPVRED